MKKTTAAITVLIGIVLSYASWAGLTVIDNRVRIAELVKEKDNIITLLTEVRNDVKKLLEKK